MRGGLRNDEVLWQGGPLSSKEKPLWKVDLLEDENEETDQGV